MTKWTESNHVFLLCFLLMLLFANGCDSCRDDDCPLTQEIVFFSLVDTTGENCNSINPELQTYLLSSNDSYDRHIIELDDDNFRLYIGNDISNYILKINDSESISLDLTRTTQIIECCNEDFEVLVDYEIRQQGVSESICTNCRSFELTLPNCM